MVPDDQDVRGFRWWTWGDLHEAVTAARQVALDRLSPGEPVAIIMAPKAEAVCTLLAAASIGNPAFLVPASLRQDELVALLRVSAARWLFVPPRLSLAMDLRLGQDFGSGWVRLSSHSSRTGAPVHEARPDDVFICQLTSGSMGSSRLAARTLKGVLIELHSVIDRLTLGAEDQVLCASSIAHSYGLIGGVLAPLLVGAPVAVVGDARQACVAADLVEPSVVFGLASTYRSMVTQGVDKTCLLRTRLALSAGAPLPPGLFRGFHEQFGLPIRQDYGTTETGTIAIDTSEDVTEGSVGKPLSHLELRLKTLINIPLGPREQGEIQLRSPSIAVGYLTPQRLLPVVDRNGWYHTRDAGWFDANGLLWVGRRLRDSVMVRGTEVHLETIEETIRLIPGVREVVACAAEFGDGQAGIKAVVVAPDLEVSTVRQWCLDHLPPSQCPTHIELCSELPRSPAGKILQKYLI
jgi:long-chain acyl-CoA synthetase